MSSDIDGYSPEPTLSPPKLSSALPQKSIEQIKLVPTKAILQATLKKEMYLKFGIWGLLSSIRTTRHLPMECQLAVFYN